MDGSDASAACDDDDAGRELCDVLAGHIRELEQREIGQMRQGAILQRKLEAAEQQLRELRRQCEQEQQAAVAQRQERRRLRSCSGERGEQRKAAELALEAELQERGSARSAEVAELEEKLQAMRAQRAGLETDLAYWRNCNQELLHEGVAAEESGGGAAAAEERAAVAEQRQRAHGVRGEAALLRRSCGDLRERLLEVEKISDVARSSQVQLLADCEAAAAATRAAELSAACAAERAAAAEQRVHDAEARCEALEARLVQEQQRAAEHEEAGRRGEAAHLAAKVEERRKEVAQLQRERARLSSSLQHHAPCSPEAAVQLGVARNLEAGSESFGGDEGAVAVAAKAAASGTVIGTLIALDAAAARVTTLLFKSSLVRKLFLAHLLLLYGWLLFLLWWMRG